MILIPDPRIVDDIPLPTLLAVLAVLLVLSGLFSLRRDRDDGVEPRIA